MPLTDYNEYLAKLSENRTADFQMSAATSRAQRLAALWPAFLPTPATPTTSVALDKTSLLSVGPIPDISTGRLTMLGARLSGSTTTGACILVMDLLNINGGLNGTVITPQTTNLPTIALTRFTSGEGVMAALVVHATVGNTATTVTISYTNQAGTPGRTSTATIFGGASFREVGAIIPIPLQAGDTGVRSVESVTVTATTGTAGNFGVCLFRPLSIISMENVAGSYPLDSVSSGCIINSLCEINPNACLSLAAIVNTNQSFVGSLILSEV